jgi:hypothetical protein
MLPNRAAFKLACGAAKGKFKEWSQSDYVGKLDSQYREGVCAALSVIFLNKNYARSHLEKKGVLFNVEQKANFKKQPVTLDDLEPPPGLYEDATIQKLLKAYTDEFKGMSFTRSLELKEMRERVEAFQSYENSSFDQRKAAGWLIDIRSMLRLEIGAVTEDDSLWSYAFSEPPHHDKLVDQLRLKEPAFHIIQIPRHALAAVRRPQTQPSKASIKFFDPNHGQVLLNSVSELRVFATTYLKEQKVCILSFTPEHPDPSRKQLWVEARKRDV